jgi:hypothetical protein
LQSVPSGRLFGLSGTVTEPVDVIREPPTAPPPGDVAYGVVSGVGAGDVVGPPAQKVGQQTGPLGRQRVGMALKVPVDGAVVAVGVAWLGAESLYCGLPLVDAVGDFGAHGVESPLGGL